MKNTFTALAIMLLIISSCQNKNITTIIDGKQDSLTQNNPLKIDSVKVLDSIKPNQMVTLLYDQSVLVFEGLNNQVLLDSIYKPTNLKIKDFTKKGLTEALVAEKMAYFKENGGQDYLPSSEQTWDQTFNMRLHSQENQLLTLVYKGSGYSGGAHGYYQELYKVFDLKINKSILLTDVVKNPKDKSWNQILMTSFLKDEDGVKDMLLEKIIPLNDNFYFDKNTITFVYNQYEITAYAAGVVYIKLDFKDVKDHLKPEFLQRINAQ